MEKSLPTSYPPDFTLDCYSHKKVGLTLRSSCFWSLPLASTGKIIFQNETQHLLPGFRENSSDASGLTCGSIDLRFFTSFPKTFTWGCVPASGQWWDRHTYVISEWRFYQTNNWRRHIGITIFNHLMMKPLNTGTRLSTGETQVKNTQFQRIVRSAQGGRQVQLIEWMRVRKKAYAQHHGAQGQAMNDLVKGVQETVPKRWHFSRTLKHVGKMKMLSHQRN